ncbi:MAG: TetR/AcrR family transcriptional regulator [Ktedonobacteraceae bacterium]
MRTKNDIITIAGGLFSERGYHGTSMRELAKSLDLQGASLYSHISSKEDVLWAIVKRGADEFLASAQAVPQNIPVEEQMERLVRGHLGVIAHKLHDATVFFQEWKFLDAARRAYITEQRNTYEAYFRRVIEEGIQQGVFSVDDAALASIFVLSALNWTYQWFRPAGLMSIEQLADSYITFIMRTLQGGRA